MPKEISGAANLFGEDPAALQGAGITPMMAQYLEIRKRHPEGLLFYRMGDFYELFFDDARQAAAALDIALTKRGRHQGEEIPMCGVPVHAADAYLERLIKKGFRVVICEQTEKPQKGVKKALLRREVVRLVSAGTITEETLLESREHNYLAALAPPSSSDDTLSGDTPWGDALWGNALWGFAFADISTGDFTTKTLSFSDLSAELVRLQPSEILIPESLAAQPPKTLTPLLARIPTSARPETAFAPKQAAKRLLDSLGSAAHAVLPDLPEPALRAAAALASYVQITQVGHAAALRPPQFESESHLMQIDAATRASLELTSSLSGSLSGRLSAERSSGGRKGSLLSIMDKTITGAGARLLARRLAQPLNSLPLIEARLDEIQFFYERPELRQKLRAQFRSQPDLSRAFSRLSLQRGTPRDLGAIRDTLLSAQKTLQIMREEKEGETTPSLKEMTDALAAVPPEPLASLHPALIAAPPPLSRDGGFIAEGYDATLDMHRNSTKENKRLIQILQTRYVQKTSLRNLKIRHNHVLGSYVEVPSAGGAELLKAPLSEIFIHRQSLSNLMRFTTEELRALAQQTEEAGQRALAREKEIFDELLARVLEARQPLLGAADALASLDVAVALAELAQMRDFVRPHMTTGKDFAIEGGRHPVVEEALAGRGDAPFIANDCHLDKSAAPLWLLTGPNMAGKSTFLRQNALIAIMAQMGSFVPAKRTKIGVMDRLFSRVGAADNLAAGHSTFMVEMVETAAILMKATESSLVIIDELGRGTATFDGLSIAWAVIEYLHDVIGCRALFATHFHELTLLEARLKGLCNRTMGVEMHEGMPVFLHDVREGVAGGSYGIRVAASAGLPQSVLARADHLLQELEERGRGSARAPAPEDSSKGGREKETNNEKTSHPLLSALKEIEPDRLSPREALSLLYDLKAKAQK